MTRKKKIELTPKVVNLKDFDNKIWIGDWEFEKTDRTVEVLKPIRNEHGSARYVDIFRYLLKVLPSDHRDFDIVASLLTYVNYHDRLTDKQVHLTNRILEYWELKGVYDV